MKKLFTFLRPIAIGLIMLFSSGWAVGQVPNAWINEIHYDNASGDANEGIEIVIRNSASWNLSLLRVDFYNGNNGESYANKTVNLFDVGVTAGSYTIYSKKVTGIQNGAPDGMALSYNGTLIQFLSYEGTILASEGVASGVTSDDIGVAETSSTTTTQSLQLTGFGYDYSGFTWAVPATATFGSINNAQTFSITWTGASNTYWETSGNWSNGIPTINYDVTIPTGKTPIIADSTSANCYDLTLEGNATLNIASTSASANGSLIFGGTYTGSATAVTYQRYMLGSQSYLLGSPLSEQTIKSFLANSGNDIRMDVTSSYYLMKHYIEGPVEKWSDPYYSSIPVSVEFELGKGYVTQRASAGIINLSGTPNNATVNVTLTRTGYGWNLLSNPFSSAIAANYTADATNNLLTANAAVLDASYTALYIWDHGSGSYKIINHLGGTPSVTLTQDYLQVGQGFFVRSKAGGETFTMTPAMQSHQTAIAFKSSEETSWVSIILNAEINDAKESTKILFREDMSSGLDIGYDAGLFKSNPDFSLYSRLVEDNGVDFGLQCLPSNYNELIIPIGLDAKAGEIVKFSINALNIPEEYAVILEDRTANTFTNLSDETAEYTIQLTNDSDGTGRFFIHTSFKSALGIDDLATENAFKVFSRAKDHQLVIRGNANENATARIYSITGKQIAVVNLKHSAENIIPFNEEAGVYIVQITNEVGTQTQKFVWVK